jgi:ribulose-5-phosphate 4-epimerase/fuculose-1-phosphate aldolase
MNAPEAAVRQSIVECYRELARRGLNGGAAGNVSVRFGEGMLITPRSAAACPRQHLPAPPLERPLT